MKPTLYLYNETDNGFELYLNGCSSYEGLSLLDKSTDFSIISFGATSYKQYGWATEKDIPLFESVGSFMEFLEAEDDIGLIELEVSIPEYGSFSSHDDGECHFIMKSKHQCVATLKVALPLQYSDMLINKLVANPGFYLSCNDAGVVTKYGSFNDYIAKNA